MTTRRDEVAFGREQVIRSAARAIAAYCDGGRTDSDIFEVSAEVFWEIDLFGRIRRATESEQAQLLATQCARRGVVISLVGEVASA